MKSGHRPVTWTVPAKPRTLLVLLALLALGSGGFGSSALGEEPGQKWVVVAGVTYGSKSDQEAGIQRLHNTLNDARQFAQFLGAPAGHVVGLYDEPGSSVGDQPTREHMVAALKETMRKAGPNDTFWFYFSGHGIFYDGRSYLAPEDVVLGRSDTMLAVGDIRKLLAENCKARVKVIVLDACESGSAKRLVNLGSHDSGTDSGETPDAETLAGNVVTMAACQVNQCAWEVPGMGGLFTYYLLRGLNGDAAKNAGTVCLADLQGYVTRELDREYRDRPLDAPQKPVFFVPDGVSTLPLAARNNDAIHHLDDKKNQDRPDKIEPLKPGLVLTITDDTQGDSPDTHLMELRLRAGLLKKGFPLVPGKQVQQFLDVFNDPSQDAQARARMRQMLSRFLVRGVMRKETVQDNVAGVDLISCRITLDVEVLDVNGAAKIPASVQGRGTGRSVASAENQAFDDAVDQIMDQLDGELSKLLRQ